MKYGIYSDNRVYALENYLARGYKRINHNMRQGKITRECRDLLSLFDYYGTYETDLKAYRAVGIEEIDTCKHNGFLSLSEGTDAPIMHSQGKSIYDVELDSGLVMYIADIFPERHGESEILVKPSLSCIWSKSDKKVTYFS